MGQTYQINAGDSVFSIAAAANMRSDVVCAALVAAGGVAAPGVTLDFSQQGDSGAPTQLGDHVEVPPSGVQFMRVAGTFGLVLVNADATNPVRYAVISGAYEDEGDIQPESGEIIAPMQFDAPVYVANLNAPDQPAIIRASILTEEMHAALAGA